VDHIISIIGGLKVTGLHISDALPGGDYRKGTHLPVGKGVVDFTKVVNHFREYDIYAALEIKGTCKDIQDSVDCLSGM